MVRDPVLFEIIKNAYETVAEEMGIAVVRSAYSTLIKEMGDACSAILDRKGQLVSQAIGAPLQHVSSLRPSLAALLEDFPAGTMREGDVYLFNDHFRGGIHSNDVMVFRPVFIHGELTYFCGALIHVADLGGISAGGLPATATEYFHEGLMIPPVKFYDAGRPDDTLVKVIQANSRTPVKVMGDINAMLGATTVGTLRLKEMIDKWGLEEVYATGQDLMDYSELRTRQDIQKIPAGRYEGSFLIDDDGIDNTRRYMVKVALQVRGPDLAIDFTGTDPQSKGPINASFSQATSGVIFAVRCFLDPTIPLNDGCWRPLKINLPYGSLVNPKPPAPANARMAVITAAIESIFQALSKAYPDKAVAASSINHVFTMSGLDEETGRYWVFMDNDYGGTGARSIKDGVDTAASLISSAHSGSLPIESVEQEYPVLYERYRILEDTGGPGKWRGGLGIERSIRILTDGEVTVRSDRIRYPPPGILGGKPGRSGSYSINPGTPSEVKLPSKKTGVVLKKGDVMAELTSGAGGYGNPWERDPELVLEDVQDRKVSVEAARRDYGVAIDRTTMSMDDLETGRLRAAMAKQRTAEAKA